MILIVTQGRDDMPVAVWRSILRLARTYDREIRVQCSDSARPDLAVMESEVIPGPTKGQSDALAERADAIISARTDTLYSMKHIVLVPDHDKQFMRDNLGKANLLVYRPADQNMISGILIGLRQLLSVPGRKPQ